MYLEKLKIRKKLKGTSKPKSSRNTSSNHIIEIKSDISEEV